MDDPDRPDDARPNAAGPGVAIKGRVAGPDGKPWPARRLESPILKIREKVVTTGPDGSFTLTAEGAPRNEFALRIDAPGMASKMFTIVTEARPLATAPLGPPGRPRPVSDGADGGDRPAPGDGPRKRRRRSKSSARASRSPARPSGSGATPTATTPCWGRRRSRPTPRAGSASPTPPPTHHAGSMSPRGAWSEPAQSGRRPLRTPPKTSRSTWATSRSGPAGRSRAGWYSPTASPCPPTPRSLASADHAGGVLRTRLERVRAIHPGRPARRPDRDRRYFPDDQIMPPPATGSRPEQVPGSAQSLEARRPARPRHGRPGRPLRAGPAARASVAPDVQAAFKESPGGADHGGAAASGVIRIPIPHLERLAASVAR